MPKRTDISKIMIIGSGPIIIGQACEFDYSGSQACRVLKEEGYNIILVNSNPATIMTDLEMADRTYIEPITPEVVTKIIERENPDAILPTLGGQIGLNIVLSLFENGTLDKFSVEVIGASIVSIKKAEFRDKFKKSMNKIGLRITKSGIAKTLNEALKIAKKIDFPLIIRSSFTMGGSGSSIVHTISDFKKVVSSALNTSPVSQVIIEESIIGWKEYELELMRDCKDNVVVICSIENMDPVGIHTGDSVTVAPVQTLTDKEYQAMRNAAINIIKEVGVNTGGANVQFAINPKTGEMLVIEMNPRVSRSSALASKATGFPIAKIATKLAIGYTLDEITNDITGMTLACFEPSIDYCVVKIPVWNNDKFDVCDDILTTKMKSVGETMAIGRTFKEAMQKAIRSLGNGFYGFGAISNSVSYVVPNTIEEIIKKLRFASSKRLIDIYYAFNLGMSIIEVSQYTKIDPWFIFQFYQIFEAEIYFKQIFNSANKFDIAEKKKLINNYKKDLIKLKIMGFSDIQIARLIGIDKKYISEYRKIMEIYPVYKSVDTCAAEFYANSPYYYSTYETDNESISLRSKKKIIVLGSGPNRIGQGIEFDYCCVHAALALNEEGISSIMVNSNPETVSTDYDISDKLYFEPLTYEDVMNVIYKENPNGVIIQFGGQISLNLSKLLDQAGVTILGTQPKNINRAEDRSLFKEILYKLGLDNPNSVAINSVNEAINVSKIIGYPLIIRPSFIIGGQSINIAYDHNSFIKFVKAAIAASRGYPVLIDEFLDNAIEIDVDIISDGFTSIICGIVEHVEKAGIHSGDSACILPSININSLMLERIRHVSKLIASELNIIGLVNIQYAIKKNALYVIEVNPRASRNIPFISKAIGIPIAKLATKVMLGKNLMQLGLTGEIIPDHISIKESIFPFERFPNSNIKLGPEMRSTGEVMGIGSSFASAYAKAQLAAGQYLPLSGGKIFINFCSENKKRLIYLASKFSKLGFDIIARNYMGSTHHFTSKFINYLNTYCSNLFVITVLRSGEIKLIIDIDSIKKTTEFNCKIRKIAVESKIPYVTTIDGAFAIYASIEFLLGCKEIKVKSLQEYHN